MDEAGIHDYLKGSDRDARRGVFVGREEERALVKTIASDANEGGRGNTVVIQGAPGAGKTALLDRLCDDVATVDPQAVVVRTNVHTLGDPQALDDALRDAAARDRPVAWARRSIEAVESIGASVLGAGLNLGLDRRARSPVERVRAIARRCLVVLAVDEAQALSRLKHDAAHTVGAILAQCHENEGRLRVLVLLAGLERTMQALKTTAGVSRLRSEMPVALGGLSDAQSIEVLVRTFERYRLPPVRADWVARWAQDACGWPQHLVVTVKAVFRHVLENGPDHERWSPRTLDHVLRQERMRFYEARFEPLQDFREEWSRIVPLLSKGPLSRRAIEAALSDFVDAPTAQRLVETAIECGVLASRGGRYHVPIPSMAQWIEQTSPAL